MGTLSCTLIVHPTLADAAAVQGFVAELRSDSRAPHHPHFASFVAASSSEPVHYPR
jgi:hypothetical protein